MGEDHDGTKGETMNYLLFICSDGVATPEKTEVMEIAPQREYRHGNPSQVRQRPANGAFDPTQSNNGNDTKNQHGDRRSKSYRLLRQRAKAGGYSSQSSQE